jgi:hypothetical protein
MAGKRKTRPKSRRKAVRQATRRRAPKKRKPAKRKSNISKGPRKTRAKSSKAPTRRMTKLQRAAKRRKSPLRKRFVKADARLNAAVREMNRGHSLTAAAKKSGIPVKTLRSYLVQQRLAARRGGRWVAKDNRPRRLPVMTGGRFRVLTVSDYDQARIVGEHHHAVGEFVRTNDIAFIRPFIGRKVQAVSGRQYPLETNPNALHRIAAIDTPPFHEIYEITSPT